MEGNQLDGDGSSAELANPAEEIENQIVNTNKRMPRSASRSSSRSSSKSNVSAPNVAKVAAKKLKIHKENSTDLESATSGDDRVAKEAVGETIKFDLGSLNSESSSSTTSSSSTSHKSSSDAKTRHSLKILNNNDSLMIAPSSNVVVVVESADKAKSKRVVDQNSKKTVGKKRGSFGLKKINENEDNENVIVNVDENTVDGFDNKNTNNNDEDASSTSNDKMDETTQDGSDSVKNHNDSSTNMISNCTNNNSSSNMQDLNSNTEVRFVDETSQSSPPIEANNADAESQVKKKRRRRTSLMVDLNNLKNGPILLSQIFVYKWPANETTSQGSTGEETTIDETDEDKLDKIFLSDMNDLYVLQEQISEYLGVKSFKRKYPDLFRRFIDIKEREYLKENNVVTETQCDLGLTALKLVDCFDLMADDYPEKYKEFSDYMHDRRSKALANLAIKEKKKIASQLQKHKADLATAAQSNSGSSTSGTTVTDSNKMKELIKKAMKSASNYNAELQKEKKDERRSYFDLQTMRLQCKGRKVEISNDKTHTNGHYPVALIRGQFNYHYKKYTSEEKNCLPLNTVMDSFDIPTEIMYFDWKKKQNEEKHKPSTATLSTAGGSGSAVKVKISEKILTRNDLSDGEDERMDVSSSFNVPPVTVHSNLNQHDMKTISNGVANQPQYTYIAVNSSNPAATTVSQTPLSSTSSSSIRITASAAPTIAKLINSANKICYVCSKGTLISSNTAKIDNNQIMINCSSCSRSSHPNCLELNPKLVDWECIRQYDWQCMECKKCSSCAKPHDEDKMMFCDRCDRGFHTYCVGLAQVPTGSWLCKTCNIYNDRVSRLSDKYSSVNLITKEPTSNPTNTSSATVAVAVHTNGIDKKPVVLLPRLDDSVNKTPTKVQNQLKSKINSSLLSNSLAANVPSSPTHSTTTPSSVSRSNSERRGRGRPPGSLNKPKDPNNPRKSPTKPIKVKSQNSTTPSVGTPQFLAGGETGVGGSNSTEHVLNNHTNNSSQLADNDFENSFEYGYVNITNYTNTTLGQYYNLEDTNSSQFFVN